MKDTITDLRHHLFETIEALKDPDQPMDIARAKAVSDVAQTVINSAKVEVQYVAAVGADASSFLTGEKPLIEGPKR